MEIDYKMMDTTELLSQLVQDERVEGIYKADCNFITSPVFFIKRRDPNGNLICDCGKGMTEKNAFLSALYEMIERIAAESFEGKEYNPEDDGSRQSDVTIKSAGNKKVCEGINLLDGSVERVSQDAVRFPPESGVGFNGTIGLASGATYSEAVVHAIYEVLEHDTISLLLQTGLPCYLVNIDERQNELLAIVEAARSKGIKCTIRLLTSSFNVYPVLVTYENMPGFENYKVAGIGCSINPVTAVRRALTECEQSAALWYEKYKTQDMEEGEIYHPSFELGFKYAFDERVICLSDIPAIEVDDEFEYLKAELSKEVSKVIAVDISRGGLFKNCVKVLIPELEFDLGQRKGQSNTQRIERIREIINECVSGREV